MKSNSSIRIMNRPEDFKALGINPEVVEPWEDGRRNDYLNKATKVVAKLLWKNELIIVFGKAVAMKAHIEMLRGNLDKAQNIVNDYMQQLSDIHESLKSQDPDGTKGYLRMSPMPECRYLLARVLWQTAPRAT